MAECLGIYLENSILKYAKLSVSNGNITLMDYGIRFAKISTDITISNIISETSSENIPIVINSCHNHYLNFNILENHLKPGYLKQVLNTELEAWCEKNAKSPEKYMYTYVLSDTKVKNNGVIDIIIKEEIQENIKEKAYKIEGIYPTSLLMSNLIKKNDENYILLDIGENTTATTVVDGKIVDIRSFSKGLTPIFERLKEKLGSYQKAYETCKQINVYADEQKVNDEEIERIIEPVLQDILKEISTFVTKHKTQVQKLYLAGNINLFRNFDLLLKDYFDLSCEYLFPFFIDVKREEKNLAEIVEVLEAMTLSYEHLLGNRKNNFLLNEKRSLEYQNVKQVNKNTRFLSYACVLVSFVFVVYTVFGFFYNQQVDKIVKDVNENLEIIGENITNIHSDIDYITENKDQYAAVNQKVDAIMQDSKENASTYHVASFLQNIMKIIPEKVTLISIRSDDNKHITIVAQADDYADLGYFVSEIKLQNTLQNVTIQDVKNGNVTVIEIGGELP